MCEGWGGCLLTRVRVFLQPHCFASVCLALLDETRAIIAIILVDRCQGLLYINAEEGGGDNSLILLNHLRQNGKPNNNQAFLMNFQSNLDI